MRAALPLAAAATLLAALLLFVRSALLVVLLVFVALAAALFVSAESERARWLYTLYSTDGDASFDAETGTLTLPSLGMFEWTDRPSHRSNPLAPSTGVAALRRLLASGTPNATIRLGTGVPFVAELTDVLESPLRLVLRALPSQSFPSPASSQLATVVVDSGESSSIESVVCSSLHDGDFKACNSYCAQSPNPSACEHYCYVASKDWVGLDTLSDWQQRCGSSFNIPAGDMIPNMPLSYSACMEAIREECDLYT